MEPEEVNNKIETMKTHLEELYGAGIIKPAEYNDIWARIDKIKVHVKYDHE